uniref:NB-ARC domain-containing protein n=1 Tax=Oryza brachyantha TaxID=4533 RepID=J3N6X9_ORYBR
MEAALLSGFIKAILPRLVSLVDDKHMLHKGVKDDVRFLLKELRMILGAIDDDLSLDRGAAAAAAAVQRLSVEELRELAHGIEDCVDGVLYRTAREQQLPSSLLRRTARVPRKLHANLQVAQELRRLRRMAEEANQRKQRYTAISSSAAAQLLEQLAERQPEQLKVIAIVGFCGLGKTALATEVYNRVTGGGGRFERYAWVCAAHRSAREVLGELLSKLDTEGRSCSGGGVSDAGQLTVGIKQQLENKRYLIVIDDIQTEDQWKNIKTAFPVDKGIGSRILVTTTIQSVANACCSANGYLHKMSRLDKNCSMQLFSKKACPERFSHYKQPDSAAILKKCDGQPLALVTVGEFLQANGWPTGPNCEDVCNRLHYHLENDKTFERMRRVLIRNYTSLPGHALKACLLYFGMFPCDHPIRRKSLLRRWLAEGFVEPLSSSSNLDSTAAFDLLMDRSIIEPINVSNNHKVKTCQTYGMMREFILHMSISQNFVTFFCDEKFLRRYVRRLSLHGDTVVDDNFNSIDLSLVRSLAVFGEAGKTVLDFSKYQLLRVLDLEKCDDLKDDHLKEICNLVLLKYLSLGSNITKLPKDVAKLKDLEALDVRRTKIKIMPVEVFQLPSLIHLLGQFKFSDKVKQKTEVQEFLLKGKSNLQTIAGFASNGSEGFLGLLSYMNKLRKLKIWCKSSVGNTNWTDLREAIQQFILDEKEANIGTRSLSLHFTGCSEDILDSLKEPCYLSSLKLHGNFPQLPQFVTSLRGLKELCLSSTKFTTDILEALSNLRYLQYLKLIADELEQFTIKDQGFSRLLRLCIVLQYPTFPIIQEGALPFLVTLQLLCKDLHGLSDIKIRCFEHLQEVTLDSRVIPATRREWAKAAKEHPNRPKVLLLKSGDTAEGSMQTILLY